MAQRVTRASKKAQRSQIHDTLPSDSDDEEEAETPHVPSAPQLTWHERLVAAYAKDPWFDVPANIKDLHKDLGLWYRTTGSLYPMPMACASCSFMSCMIAVMVDTLVSPKTINLVCRMYWWPSVTQHVTDYVRMCHTCQKNKARNTEPSGLLQPLELPLVPWE